MRVAIDTSPLTSGHAVRGIGFYTKNLIEALGNKAEAVDFTKKDLSGYDVVHYPYMDLFFYTLPIKKVTKTVVTVHDVIPLLYPSHYPPGIRGKVNFLLQKYSLKSIDAVITDTETSKKDICRFLGVSASKIFVVPLAPGEIFKKIEDRRLKIEVKKRYILPDRFVLYLGDVNYNKNIPNLIAACEIAKTPLVICGKQALEVDMLAKTPQLAGPRDWVRYLLGKAHPEIEHFRGLSGKFRKSKNIIRLGFVLDSDLVSILNLASAYVQSSYYEGFGLPVLQAFASGTPVVASKTQALVEIGGNAAIFADPNSPNDFAEKILEVCNNKKLRDELIEKGFTRVREFSWQKTATETLAVYQHVHTGNI